MEKTLSEQIYGYLADDEDARVCKDIPDAACNEQPISFTLQLVSQSLSKLADTLSSAKLVLAWILSSLGAPAIFLSLLVPVRESLSLLPQLFIAQVIRELPVRKWAWVAGAIGQSVALIGMVIAIGQLTGAAAGYAVIGLLALLSLSRGICSVAHKDVLGKTISKSRRGRLTGTATTISGVIALGSAALLILGLAPENLQLYAVMLLSAAALWMIAAFTFGQLPEVAGATEGGGNAFSEALQSLSLLKTDEDFRAFVIARALLIATAFATPYLVILIQQSGSGALTGLGVLIFADGLAAMSSGYFWGKLSDTRSHHVMALSAVLSVLTIATAIALYTFQQNLFTHYFVGGSLLFLASVAHQGTRVGRKTYLVDLANSDNRAQYTAVGNTVIGVMLLVGGTVGIADAMLGTISVLYILAAVGILAIMQSLRLKNVAD